MAHSKKKILSSITKKTIFLSISIVVVLLILSGITLAIWTKTQINEIFKLNVARKSEGYYVAEFELKMLAIVYYLDHSDYLKALATLNNSHQQLKTTEGLIKIPKFSNKKEQIAFYRNLQNPKTGAFMRDDTIPLFTYIGVTANMIAAIEELSRDADEPFQIQYPLRFFDQINTPETLQAFLDDLSTVGWLAAKLPKSPFVEIGELLELASEVERLGLYTFSPAWKQAFLQWCYTNQDQVTGLWGPRLRGDHTLLNDGDITDSEKIIKLFVDYDGNEIHPEFPLRHRTAIFASALKKLARPMPDDLDALHDWIISQDRGLRFLTRYLWKYASQAEKDATRKHMEAFIRIRFEQYYVAQEQAFSLYPHAEHADLDGTGEALGMFAYLGAFSTEKQRRLWGEPTAYVADLGTHPVSELTEGDLNILTQDPNINSIRFYPREPGQRYLEEVEGVVYPRTTLVLDLANLLPNVANWVNSTSQQMGNWVTKEAIRQEYLNVNLRVTPITNGLIPLQDANRILRQHAMLVAIGFDVLQLPRAKIVYTHD